jgi:hypothetical protein
MRWFTGWPVGLALIASIIGVNGVASLVEAFELAVTGTGDWTAIGFEGMIGVLLLHRAFALLFLQPAGWLVTVIVLLVHAGIMGDEIARGHAPLSSWSGVIISVLSILYLLTPGVRSLFANSGANRR